MGYTIRCVQESKRRESVGVAIRNTWLIFTKAVTIVSAFVTDVVFSIQLRVKINTSAVFCHSRAQRHSEYAFLAHA